MSDTQAINIIEDAEGELRVSSLIIAHQTENQHKNVLGLIRGYDTELHEFGDLAFETLDRIGTPGPPQQVALLNEPQSTFLISLMRNSEVVTGFKIALVKEFYRMRQVLTQPKSLAERSLELLGELSAEVERQAHQIEALTPRADAWDELASADGDYEVADAAKILARAGIETGRQRLFGQLENLGWIFRGPQGKWKARQSAVDSGYLAEKPQWHFHPKTGDKVLDPPQVRVTVKGLERMRVRLGSVLRAVEAVS